MVRRRLVERGDEARSTESKPEQTGIGLSAWLNEPKVKTASRGALSDFDAALLDAEARAKSGDWSTARAPSFVGLYSLCHRRLYRVEPAELRNKTDFRAAARMASMMLNRFDGDGTKVADFIVWTWERQKRRDEWFARKNAENGERREVFRIGYRLQFSIKLETDYRVEMAAASNKARRA